MLCSLDSVEVDGNILRNIIKSRKNYTRKVHNNADTIFTETQRWRFRRDAPMGYCGDSGSM